MRKNYVFIIFLLIGMMGILQGNAQSLTGTKTIDPLGSGQNNYTTLIAAITDINTNGVGTGGVVFNVASGFTETAPAGGYVITASGTSSNQIVFNGNSANISASASLVAGNLNDAIIKLMGTDWISISGFVLHENSANTVVTVASNNMTEWGIAVLYASTTNGAKNVTIQNNTISLDRTYSNTFGIYANSRHAETAPLVVADITSNAGSSDTLHIYGNSISNINVGIAVIGSTTGVLMAQGLDIGGSNISTGNTITNFGTSGTFSAFPSVNASVNGIYVNNNQNFNIGYNVITSSVGGVTAGTLRGIYIEASGTLVTTGTFSNSIKNNSISLKSGLNAGAMQGILNSLGNATTSISITNNDINNTTHSTSSGTPSGVITFISNTATAKNITISANTFTNLSVNTTGNVIFITSDVTMPANGTETITNNSIVTAFAKTGSGGTVSLYAASSSSSPNTSTYTATGNNFSNITVVGTAVIAGWVNAEGSGVSKNISNNIFNSWNAGTGAMTGISINYSGTNTSVSNNTITNFTSSGGAITGITLSSSNNPTLMTVSTNTISNFTTSSGNILGISNATTTATNIEKNIIHTLSSAGASNSVIGITSSGGVTVNIYGNKISNLQESGASGTVTGVNLTGGTTVTTYNNMIADLRATTTTAASAPNQVIGMSVTGGTTQNIYYNTVVLSGTSTGANFGSSAISMNATPSITLRNNLFINNATATGIGASVALRKSTTALTNYSSSSNNNIFYAGTPGTANLIFYDGTNLDQTVAAFKTRVSPRESYSGTHSTPFINASSTPFDVHINTSVATASESSGLPIAGITTDIDGDTRNTNFPDLGADEGTFVLLDIFSPIVSFTSVPNTAQLTNRTISGVTITDASTVNISTAKARVYYRKKSNTDNVFNTNTSATAGWKYAESASTTSPFTFTIDYSLLNSAVANGDTIQYFIVAQDNAVTPNITLTSGVLNTTATSVDLSTNFPITGTISNYLLVSAMPANVTIGAGGTYTSLTGVGGLFAAINSSVLTQDLTATVISSTTETGANALNQFTEDGVGNYTLRIVPSAASVFTLSGNYAGGLITFNGTDRVIIDGNFSNDGKYLTFQNDATTTSAVIYLKSLGAGAGASNISIKNCNIVAGTTSTSSFGIYSGGASISTSGTGADNDQLKIQNNSIKRAFYGLYAAGTDAGKLDNLEISGNEIGSDSQPEYIRYCGMWVQYADKAKITTNKVFNVNTVASTSALGIMLSTGVINSRINKNDVHSIRYVGTSDYGTNGIVLNTAVPNSLDTVDNNIVGDIGNSADNIITNATYGCAGIQIRGTTAGSSTGGVLIAHNSVVLNGSYPTNTYTSISAAFHVQSAVTNLKVVNNIFMNRLYKGVAASRAYSVISQAPASAFTTMNNNMYWFPGIQGRAGYINGTEYSTLAQFSAATLKDSTSYNDNPLFTNDSIDLHINAGTTPSLLESKGIVLAGISTDIDGQTRPGPAGSVNGGGTLPDIGADEFDGVPNLGDVTNPTFVLDSISPALNTCLAVPHIFYVSATDASGIDSVILFWSRNGVPQTQVSFTYISGNRYQASIPSNLDSVISYSFRTVDASINKNAVNTSGGTYLDQSFKPKAYAKPTSINVGGTVNLEAQAPGKAAVGLGSSVTSGTTYPNPFNPYYGGSKHQFLILASELTAAGIRAGDINSIAFDLTGTNSSTQTNKGFTISLGATSVSQLSATFIDTGLIQVTTPTTYQVTGTGYANNTFNFYRPFTWDGQSNIIVSTCFSNANSGGGSVFGGHVKYTTTSFTSTSYYRADNLSISAICGATAATGTSSNRPNISFGSAKTVGIGTNTYSWTSSANGGLTATNIQSPTAIPNGGAGTYKYYVTSGNGTCNYLDSVSVLVSLPIKPIPDFTSNLTTATSGGVTSSVNFTDISTNIPDTWKWVFIPNTVSYVNGTSSTSQNPVVQFNAAGVYSVKFLASNGAGIDSITKLNYITVTLDYCNPIYGTASGQGSSSGDFISSVVLGTLNNPSLATPNPPYTNYTTNSSITVPDLTGGSSDTLKLNAGSYSGGSEAFAAWIDYNQNGVFETTEKIGEVSGLPAVAYALAKLPFTVPVNATPGLTRMRVREAWGTTNFDPCSIYSYGEAEDYSVNIIAAPAMVYQSSITEQNVLPAPPGSSDQVVIGIKVVTSGYSNPIVASKFSLSSAGTTSLSDISNAKIYYTGNSKTFATTSLYGTATPNVKFNISGSQVLLSDTNYFWLTYDVVPGALIGNFLDATCDTINLSSVNTFPSVTAPSGNKSIGAYMTIVSSTVNQVANIPVYAGSIENAIIRVDVNMSSGVPVPASKLRFTAQGTSNISNNLTQGKVYFTGSNPIFSPTNLFGSAQALLLDTFEFNGNALLGQGVNYFWLAFDVPSSALVGDSIDASFEGVVVNGVKMLATVHNPSGNRKILAGYCPSVASLFVTSDEEDIGNVTITNQFGATLLNNGNAIPPSNNSSAVNTYTDFRNVVPPVNLAKLINNKIVVRPIWTGPKYAENIHVYLDLNKNGVFTDAGEKIAFGTVTVGTDSLVRYFKIPQSVTTGYTVMRVIDIWSSTTFPGPCGDYSYGETEDYLINITPPPPGDYYAPDLSNIVLTPPAQCTSVAHTLSATITDTSGVDSAWVLWTLNGIQQLPILMTNIGNTYSASIPAQGNNIVGYAIRTIDIATNNNEITTTYSSYQDEYFKVTAGIDKYVGINQTAQLSANTTLDKPFRITEFNLFNSNGGTNGSNVTWPSYLPTNMYDDNIEITNLSPASVNLSDYALITEGMTTNHNFTFPSGVIVPPQGVVIVHLGTGITNISNLLFSTGSGSLPSSGASIGIILKDNLGNVKDAVATNSFVFSGSNGVSSSDWTGAGVSSPSGGAGATLQGSDLNNSTNWVTATNSSSPVSIGFLNPSLPTLPSASTITWSGGVLSGTVTGSTITTPVHPSLGVYTYYANSTDGFCNSADTILVNVIGAPTVDLGPNGSICGTSPRVLDAGNPGSTYLWSTGETTQIISANAAGTFKVTVTNQINLVASDSIVLTAAPAMVFNLAPSRELCTGATITLDAGAGFSSYLWSTGATTQSIQVNATGNYYITVANSGGCIAKDTISVVPVVTPPTVNLGADQAICKSAPLTLDAGNVGSTYLWSTGETTQTIVTGSAGIYSVVVSTLSGCVITDTVVISNLPSPVFALGADVAICNGSSITLNATVAGATYVWSTGATTPTITVNTAGTYRVTVTGTNGCFVSDTIIVSIKASPIVNLGVNINKCAEDTVTLDAGNVGATYLWSTGATTQTIKVTNAAIYSVAVTNTVGCTTSDDIEITNKPVPNSSFTIAAANGQSVTFQAVEVPGNVYSWNFGDPTSPANTSQLANPTHKFTTPGNFNVTLTITNLTSTCVSSTTDLVAVTGVGNDFAKVFEFGAAPNPFVNQTKISYVLTDNAENVSLEVYDLLGKKVATLINNESQKNGRYKYDYVDEVLTNSSGIYILKLMVDGKVAISKILKVATK